MGKVITVSFLMFFMQLEATSLDKNCISCHQKLDIPSQLIYKRYLLKYSTDEYMEEVIFNYLKNPKKEQSIMPKVFFTKFPVKTKMNIKDKILVKNIRSFLKKFDIKKRLILEK